MTDEKKWDEKKWAEIGDSLNTWIRPQQVEEASARLAILVKESSIPLKIWVEVLTAYLNEHTNEGGGFDWP